MLDQGFDVLPMCYFAFNEVLLFVDAVKFRNVIIRREAIPPPTSYGYTVVLQRTADLY